MMESIPKTMNSVSSSNYLFDDYLSASAWYSISSLRISQRVLPDDLRFSVMSFHSTREKKLPSTLHLNSTCTFLFQNLSFH